MSEYDIIFITNPTFLHYETLKRCLTLSNNIFIEKPLFENSNYDLNELTIKDSGIYYIACPLRFNPVIDYLKEHLSKYSVYSVRVICSSYLPEWRNNIDYRNNYSAKKELGGGVSLDLIHEIDILHIYSEILLKLLILKENIQILK